MSKLRERLEEGKGTVPEPAVVGHVKDILRVAGYKMLEAAEQLRIIRKTTKAYRGKELKKLQDQTNKLIIAMQNLETTVGDDFTMSQEKFGEYSASDYKKNVKLQKDLDKKVMRQIEY